MRSLLHRFDYYVTALIQQWPDWVTPIMLFVTFIGQPIFTVGIGFLIAGIGFGKVNHRLFYAGLAVVATFCLSSMLKVFFQRDRPLTEYVLHMRSDTFSFPSGHAAGGVVAYGLLAYLALQLLPQPWNYITASILAVVIILIGISRIYLGAHFPSDVIAGWLLGLAGLAVIIFIIRPIV